MILRYMSRSKRTHIPTPRAARPEAPRLRSRERMLHIRLDPELHRALRVIVAEQDTTLQEWVVRTLAAAARRSADDSDTI